MAEFLSVLKPKFQPKFKKQFRKLHPVLQKKFTEQLTLLLENPRPHSLKTRKMSGTDFYEARLDEHNRFVYQVVGEEVWFYSVGPHDEGLGKK